MIVGVCSKRVNPGKGLGPPPNQAIWAPLIQHLNQHNEYFVEELVACTITLVGDNATAESDPTFSATIAAWVLWTVDALGDEPGTLRKDCVRNLLSSAGPGNANLMYVLHLSMTLWLAETEDPFVDL